MVRSSGSDNVDHHGPVFHFCPTWAEVPDAKTVTIMVTINFWSSWPEVNYRKSPQLGNLFDNSCLLENGVQLGHNFTSGHDGQKLTINEPSEIVANLATINFRTSCPEVEALLLHPNLGWSQPASTCDQLKHKLIQFKLNWIIFQTPKMLINLSTIFQLVAKLATSQQPRFRQKSRQVGETFQLRPNLGRSCHRRN